MKKLAFTLAEMLITLAIVGVVAAVTMPLVINSSQNQRNAAALAVAISDWENAMAAMMSADGATDLTETALYSWMNEEQIDTDDMNNEQAKKFTGEISKYLNVNSFFVGMDKFDDDSIVKWLNGEEYNTYYIDANEEYIVLTTPKGFAYGVFIFHGSQPSPEKEEEIIEAGGSLTRSIGNIRIDVNGKSKPNTFGRDIFFFRLSTDGMLYPYGGYDESMYVSQNDERTWKNSNEGPEGQCVDFSTSYGVACTGRLVENNFKMDY